MINCSKDPSIGTQPIICKSFSFSLNYITFFSEYVQTIIETKYQNCWEEMAQKADENWEWKQTHFLLVFSTINIGFYPQKYCNRQRHHNEANTIRNSIFLFLKSIFPIFFSNSLCMCCSHIVFQRYGTFVFIQKAGLNLILVDHSTVKA